MSNISVFLQGFAIGSANVIPGVSGGTLALIFGILERLIKAINSFEITAIKLFFSGKWRRFWQHIDGTFLLLLVLGAGLAIVSMARLVSYLFYNYPTAISAFFFGLIAMSVYFLRFEVAKWKLAHYLLLALGLAIAVSLSFLSPANSNGHPLYLFICGVLAISSQLLPGISGSFVLILLGNYTLVIDAVKNLDIITLIPFAVGCLLGIFTFSRVLAFLLRKRQEGTMALLIGFVLGSLVVIWPWQMSEMLASGLEVKRAILPAGEPLTELLIAAFCAALGAFCLFIVENRRRRAN